MRRAPPGLFRHMSGMMIFNLLLVLGLSFGIADTAAATSVDEVVVVNDNFGPAEMAGIASDLNLATNLHEATASVIFGAPPGEMSDQQVERAQVVNFAMLYASGALPGQLLGNLGAPAYLMQSFDTISANDTDAHESRKEVRPQRGSTPVSNQE